VHRTDAIEHPTERLKHKRFVVDHEDGRRRGGNVRVQWNVVLTAQPWVPQEAQTEDDYARSGIGEEGQRCHGLVPHGTSAHHPALDAHHHDENHTGVMLTRSDVEKKGDAHHSRLHSDPVTNRGMGDEGHGEATLPRVLVVDDEPCVRRSIVSALRHVAVMAEAGGVSAATALLRECEPFDAIVCDVNLGDGLGWEVLDHARARSADTAITMLSGDARNAPHAKTLGVLLMQKPFDTGALVRSLRLPPAVSRSTVPPATGAEEDCPKSQAS
jgi:CheY-like chemotaxis protein